MSESYTSSSLADWTPKRLGSWTFDLGFWTLDTGYLQNAQIIAEGLKKSNGFLNFGYDVMYITIIMAVIHSLATINNNNVIYHSNRVHFYLEY